MRAGSGSQTTSGSLAHANILEMEAAIEAAILLHISEGYVFLTWVPNCGAPSRSVSLLAA
eukprot:5859096-Pyramimonas_sp.AAC.1